MTLAKNHELDLSTLEFIDAPSFLINSDKLIVWANESFYATFNSKEEDVINKTTCQKLCNMHLCGTKNCPADKAIKQNKPVTSESINRDQAGAIRYFHSSARPVNGNGGNALISMTDITAAKQIETRLNQLETNFNSLPTPTIEIDTSFTITFINPAGAAVVGLPVNEVIGRKCHDLFKTPHCKTDKCACGRAMRENAVVSETTIARPREGMVVPIKYTGAPIKDAKGNIKGALEFILDVTEEARQRQQANEKIENLNSIPTPIISVDTEFGITFINPAGASVLGASVDQLIGRKCYDLFKTPHCKTDKCACARAMQEDAIITEETVANPRKDVSIPIKYTGAPMKDAKGNIKGALEFVVDVTAEARAKKHISDVSLEVYELVKKCQEQMNKVKESMGAMADSLKNQVSLLNQSDATVKNMLDSSSEMSTMTNKVGEMSSVVASEAESGRKAGAEAGSKMPLINESMQKSNQMVANLVTQLEKISGFVDIIKDIASQTNLLAFNAAIEAARAGDAGRGFAVVADEVRKLAEKSSKSAVDISGIVKKVENESRQTIDAMGNGMSMLDVGCSVINNALKAMEEITGGITGISTSIGDLRNRAIILGERGENVVAQLASVFISSEENQAQVCAVQSAVADTDMALAQLVTFSEALRKTNDVPA